MEYKVAFLNWLASKISSNIPDGISPADDDLPKLVLITAGGTFMGTVTMDNKQMLPMEELVATFTKEVNLNKLSELNSLTLENVIDLHGEFVANSLTFFLDEIIAVSVNGSVNL